MRCPPGGSRDHHPLLPPSGRPTTQGITTLCRGPAGGSRFHPLSPTASLHDRSRDHHPLLRPRRRLKGSPPSVADDGPIRAPSQAPLRDPIHPLSRRRGPPYESDPCPDVTRTAQAEREAPRSLRLPAWGVPPGHWTAWSLNSRRRATSTVVTAPSIPVGPRCSQRLRAAHTPPRARRLTTHC